jgi:hypothetical protein
MREQKRVDEERGPFILSSTIILQLSIHASPPTALAPSNTPVLPLKHLDGQGMSSLEMDALISGVLDGSRTNCLPLSAAWGEKIIGQTQERKMPDLARRWWCSQAAHQLLVPIQLVTPERTSISEQPHGLCEMASIHPHDYLPIWQ